MSNFKNDWIYFSYNRNSDEQTILMKKKDIEKISVISYLTYRKVTHFSCKYYIRFFLPYSIFAIRIYCVRVIIIKKKIGSI